MMVFVLYSLHTFPTFTRVTCNGFAITDLFILFINKHNNWLQCVFNNSFTRKIIIKNDVNTHNAILQSCDDRAKFSPENEIKRDSSLSYADKKKVLVISMRQMKWYFSEPQPFYRAERTIQDSLSLPIADNAFYW